MGGKKRDSFVSRLINQFMQKENFHKKLVNSSKKALTVVYSQSSKKDEF